MALPIVPTPDAERKTYYGIYGLCVSGVFRYFSLPKIDCCKPDINLKWCVGPVPKQDEEPHYSSPYIDRNGNPVTQYFIYPDKTLLLFPEHAGFFICGDSVTCVCPEEKQSIAEDIFLSILLAQQLELRGQLALHASACQLSTGAIAFCGQSTSGKSSIVSGFVASGYKFITDDILALQKKGGEFTVAPGIPYINMWNDQASYFLSEKNYKVSESNRAVKMRVKVGFTDGWGNYCNENQILRKLFVLQRRQEGDNNKTVDINLLSKREAVVMLLRTSYIPRIVKSLGLSERRLPLVASLADQVPVYFVHYPSKYSVISDVVEKLVEFCEGQ